MNLTVVRRVAGAGFSNVIHVAMDKTFRSAHARLKAAFDAKKSNQVWRLISDSIEKGIARGLGTDEQYIKKHLGHGKIKN